MTSAPFLRRAELTEDCPTEGHPFDLPVVRQLATIPLGQTTILVGDNGSGKSTIVEALAVAAGFNAEGGGRNLVFRTHSTHSQLHDHLTLVWERRPAWGWFLRAESFYGMATHIATDDPQHGVGPLFPDLHAESHGESFIDLAASRFRGAGLYLLDEPESALSLQGQLKLLRIMHDRRADGAQFILATHSPVLMAFPGAVLVELDEDGAHTRAYDDVLAVQLWRRFLGDPASILQHLFED